ncbi:helix-turn-helix domain-containing protein [Cobetia crustatorum]|uniref:helix-turn-helix domain-containing protein n=1 Tax=Cobetia crustatorum TaxID=553385 RepID=UPI00046A1546|nr:helix-turn-helix domain-containing protein [Cobetia crustatorum]
MASITVNEAAELVGRSRRTLYRDMKRGNLSFTTRRDGHRQIDTSELERCYGALKMPEPGTLSRASSTASDDVLIAEIRALREELVGLREEVAKMRRLPAPEAAQDGQVFALMDNKLAAEMAALRAKREW